MTISTVQVGQSALLTLTLYQDGNATDLGTVTIGIVDANGTTVVAPGTAVTDGSNGTYTYTLTKRTQPQFLINTWSVSGGPTFTTYTDVQGSILFDEASLRAFDDGSISDTTEYGDDAIAKMHQRVVEHMEAFTGRSWVRRYNRIVLPGMGSLLLDLSSRSVNLTSAGLMLYRPGAHLDVISIISADDGAAITPANIIVLSDGLLQRTDEAWTAASSESPLNVTVEYEYGQPYPVDGADRIAMMIARHWLVSTRIPPSASAFNDALGTFSFDESRLPWEAFSWLKNHKIQGFFA